MGICILQVKVGATENVKVLCNAPFVAIGMCEAIGKAKPRRQGKVGHRKWRFK